MALQLPFKQLYTILSSLRLIIVGSLYKYYILLASAAVTNFNLLGFLKDIIIINTDFFFAKRQGNFKNIILIKII